MNKLLSLLLLFISFNSLALDNTKLQNFETDMCTYFPEGTGAHPKLWQDCCIYHDMKYWVGGTQKEQDSADLTLKACVLKKANAFYANLMYQGVRLGHYSPIKSQYRWGWGWNPEGYYGRLSEEQKQLALKLILKSHIDSSLIKRFIHDLSQNL